MNTNAQIITDLKKKIGTDQVLDFLSDWKGVPVVVKGYIHEIRDESIIFQVEPPDSICFDQDDHALILHDIFIMGIQGRILTYDPQKDMVELGEFIYMDRGFGNRSTARVEPNIPIPAELVLPEAPIPAELVLDETAIVCQVVDISLNGFGLLAEFRDDLKTKKGESNSLKLNLLDQEIEIPGMLVNIIPKGDTVRLAMSFSQEAPGSLVVTRYISRRRAEIRQEIQNAYQLASGKSN